LGDFEDFNGVDILSFVKEHNSTLNFPQKVSNAGLRNYDILNARWNSLELVIFLQQLMLLLMHVDKENAKNGGRGGCISWTDDGHAFTVRDRAQFVKTLLPLFFRGAKFSSFTRKLYRWGFRQICIPKGQNNKDREMFFGHEHFQRDDKSLMAHMRSVTAAGTRRAIAALSTRKKAKMEAAKSRQESASLAEESGSVESERDGTLNEEIASVSQMTPFAFAPLCSGRPTADENTATLAALSQQTSVTSDTANPALQSNTEALFSQLLTSSLASSGLSQIISQLQNRATTPQPYHAALAALQGQHQLATLPFNANQDQVNTRVSASLQDRLSNLSGIAVMPNQLACLQNLIGQPRPTGSAGGMPTMSIIPPPVSSNANSGLSLPNLQNLGNGNPLNLAELQKTLSASNGASQTNLQDARLLIQQLLFR
jgi:hypothetical protein